MSDQEVTDVAARLARGGFRTRGSHTSASNYILQHQESEDGKRK